MTRRAISTVVDKRVREAAQYRCGYCLSPQQLVMARLEIEHIIPLSKGGTDDESNLWLACPICNGHKSNKVTAIDPESGLEMPLFNPRERNWFDHFRWDKDGIHLSGITPVGRATIDALLLNEDPDALIVRSFWVSAGWHPPDR